MMTVIHCRCAARRAGVCDSADRDEGGRLAWLDHSGSGACAENRAGRPLTLEQVQGPGQFTLYLENGNFSKPQVLWDSSKHEPQDIWVEKNTHTHANWCLPSPAPIC